MSDADITTGWGGTMRAGGSAYRNATTHLDRVGKYTLSYGPTSPTQEVVRSRSQGVTNARAQDRNSSRTNAGISKRAVNLVGSNLRLQAKPNWRALGLTAKWARELSQKAENLFSLWGDDHRNLCDAERHYQFGGLMWLAARNCFGAEGETLIHIRLDENRRQRYKSRFATFIEVVDPDRIGNPPEIPEGWQPDGTRVVSGRVLDEYGAYTDIWQSTTHPGDVNGAIKYVKIPRETDYGRPIAVHWFLKERSGMQRQMPSIIQSLRENTMFDQFNDNQLKSAVLQTFLSMYIKTDATSAEALAKLQAAPTGGTSSFEDQWDARFGLYDKLNLNIDGQPIPVLAPGDDLGTVEGQTAHGDTDSFRYAFERGMASNLHLSYPEYSNDYSKTSFASIRAELIGAWRTTFAERYMFTSHTATNVYVALMEEWIAFGDIVLPPGAPDFYENVTAYCQCEWRGPGMGWVDPVKDAQGAGMRMSAGLTSPQREAASQGEDWRDTIDDIAEAKDYAEEQGVDLVWGSGSAALTTAEAPEVDGGIPQGKKGKGKSPGRDGDGDGQIDEKDTGL